MKKHQIELALTKMGYRHMGKDVWAKPIGHHIFTFNLNKGEWLNLFKALTDETHIWDSKSITVPDNEDDFLNTLKMYEQYTNISSGSNQTNFEFLTIEEQVSFL
jgi:hypothetical protein